MPAEDVFLSIRRKMVSVFDPATVALVGRKTDHEPGLGRNARRIRRRISFRRWSGVAGRLGLPDARHRFDFRSMVCAIFLAPTGRLRTSVRPTGGTKRIQFMTVASFFASLVGLQLHFSAQFRGNVGASVSPAWVASSSHERREAVQDVSSKSVN